MVTNAEIEGYLERLGMPFDSVPDAEGLWVLHQPANGNGGGTFNIVISHQPPLTIFRVKLMDIPQADDQKTLALLRKLLELNATDMIGGAYGIEENSVVCGETLQSENLDFNEFRAAVEALFMAITEHYHCLHDLR